MRISDWSSDVCSSDLDLAGACPALFLVGTEDALLEDSLFMHMRWLAAGNPSDLQVYPGAPHNFVAMPCNAAADAHERAIVFIKQCLTRSEEHTSGLQSLMRNSYAVFCLKKKKTNTYALKSRYRITISVFF